MSQPILRAHGIVKRFGPVTALNGVSFDLREGEIHSLCGENGADKSTLIKTLSGIYAFGSYEGELFLQGEPLRLKNIADAEQSGIAVIYQELALVPELSVAENIYLGNEPRRGPFVDWLAVFAGARTAGPLRRRHRPDGQDRRLGRRAATVGRDRQGFVQTIENPDFRRADGGALIFSMTIIFRLERCRRTTNISANRVHLKVARTQKRPQPMKAVEGVRRRIRQFNGV